MLKPVWLVLLPLIPEACSFCSLPSFSSVPPNQIKTLLSARFSSFYLLTWQTHEEVERTANPDFSSASLNHQAAKLVSKRMSLSPGGKEPLPSAN